MDIWALHERFDVFSDLDCCPGHDSDRAIFRITYSDFLIYTESCKPHRNSVYLDNLPNFVVVEIAAIDDGFSIE